MRSRYTSIGNTKFSNRYLELNKINPIYHSKHNKFVENTLLNRCRWRNLNVLLKMNGGYWLLFFFLFFLYIRNAFWWNEIKVLMLIYTEKKIKNKFVWYDELLLSWVWIILSLSINNLFLKINLRNKKNYKKNLSNFKSSLKLFFYFYKFKNNTYKMSV